MRLEGFTDENWPGSSINQKRTLGSIFKIGSTTISWFSRNQRSVALSLVEAKYMVASLVACEAIWTRKLIMRLFK